MLIYLLSHQPEKLKSSKMQPRAKKTKVHKLLGTYTPEDVISIASTPKSGDTPTIYKHLFNLETQKITALVPELRFRKVFASTDNFQPFYLPISSEYDGVYRGASSKNKTAGAVGVRSFSVTTEGTDPFTAPRYLTAKLEIFVDHLDNIFNPPPGYAPLADIFTLSIAGQTSVKSSVGGVPVTGGELSRPIEVEATLGYTIADDRREIFKQEEIDEIIATRLTLRMNVFNHSISVNQDGTATISIDYTARINTINSSIYSAISSPEEVIKLADIRVLALEGKEEKSNSQVSAAPSANKSSSELQANKMLEIRQVLEHAEMRGKIPMLVVKPEEITDFNKFHLPKETAAAAGPPTSGSFATPPGRNASATLARGGAKTTLSKRIQDFDNSKREIHYIFFGDLIESFFEKYVQTLTNSIEIVKNIDRLRAAGQSGINDFQLSKTFLDAIKEKTPNEKTKIIKVLEDSIKSLTRFRIMLANVTYKYFLPNGGGPNEDVGTRTVNIADIPISLELYQKYMYEKVYSADKTSYTLKEFLKDSYKELLPKAFGESYWSVSDIAPRVLVTRPVFTSSTFSATQLRGEIGNSVEVDIKNMPSHMRTKEPVRIDDECDFLFIYQKPDKQTGSARSGTEWEDIKAGIYHFLIGKNRGLIKDINFSRFDVPYAREQLMTNQVGLYDELKVPYNATITMFGNNLFMPGSRIFVNPSSIGFGDPSDVTSPSYRLGLGGYYTVLKVSTNIADGVAETVLECTFGDHARASTGLTNAIPVADAVLGSTPSQSLVATPDAEAQPTPTPATPVRAAQLSTTRTGLESIRDSNGKRILSSQSADSIVNDYVSNPDNDILASARIPGVVERRSHQDGSVEYTMSSGHVIKIDSSGGTSAASVVRESGKSIEELADEKSIGKNPRTISRNDRTRDASTTDYEPPGRGKPS